VRPARFPDRQPTGRSHETHLSALCLRHASQLSLAAFAIAVFSGGANAQRQNKAYVASGGAHVTAIDTATEAVVGTIPTGTGPVAVTIAPDGRRAYASKQGLRFGFGDRYGHRHVRVDDPCR